MRSTKVVATLGPATDEGAVLRKLIEAGANVFRLNFSHGRQEEHARRIEAIRAAASKTGTRPGILMDLQGPKIRLGRFEGGAAELATGADFTITTREVQGTAALASTTYAALPSDVQPGDRILLADGAVELRVLSAGGGEVRTTVVSGGRIGDRKGINLPGVAVSSPAMTEKDHDDLEFGLKHGVDFVALSFVRRAQDVERLRAELARTGARPLIVSKIEKPEAFDNLEAILEASDGVMVARGDLGVEMPADEVPYIQKSIIRAARRRGRFVITATQMLESMIENPNPTRAEVSDVANAIFDGTDAVMLSGETSVGKHPVEAVRTMARIAEEADSHPEFGSWEDLRDLEYDSDAESVAAAAYQAALSDRIRAVAVFTMSGASARLVSRLRPPVPVYAFTPADAVVGQLSVSHGVHAIAGPEVRSTDEIFAAVERTMLDRGLAARGEAVVIVAGVPVGKQGATNLLKVHRLG